MRSAPRSSTTPTAAADRRAKCGVVLRARSSGAAGFRVGWQHEVAITGCLAPRKRGKARSRSAQQSKKRGSARFVDGITSLFAALDIVSGKVIGQTHRRHRSVEFRKFLERIEREVPADLEIHLVLDNYRTHKAPLIRRCCSGTRASTCTSRRRTRRGSTRSSAGSPASPRRSCAAGRTAAPASSRTPTASTSPRATSIPSPSSG